MTRRRWSWCGSFSRRRRRGSESGKRGRRASPQSPPRMTTPSPSPSRFGCNSRSDAPASSHVQRARPPTQLRCLSPSLRHLEVSPTAPQRTPARARPPTGLSCDIGRGRTRGLYAPERAHMVYILLRLVLQEDDEALRAALGPAGAALLANEGEGDDEREGAVSPSQYSYETLVRLGASPPHTLPPHHTPLAQCKPHCERTPPAPTPPTRYACARMSRAVELRSRPCALRPANSAPARVQARRLERCLEGRARMRWGRCGR